MAETPLQRLAGPHGALAYRLTEGAAPCVVWLCGFGSDMSGTKATALEQWARSRGQAFLRFDYSGCGESGGAFEAGTISAWTQDALVLLDALVPGRIVLVGSSMGGWISLLIARRRPEQIAGMLLIAAAPDFTQRLMEPGLPEEGRAALAATGRWERPSAYGPPQPITRALIEDGARNHVLTGLIPFAGPVRLLHGQADPDVPWELSLEIAERLASPDVTITFVKDGDHRLSRPQDITLLENTLAALLALLSPQAADTH